MLDGGNTVQRADESSENIIVDDAPHTHTHREQLGDGRQNNFSTISYSTDKTGKPYNRNPRIADYENGESVFYNNFLTPEL